MKKLIFLTALFCLAFGNVKSSTIIDTTTTTAQSSNQLKLQQLRLNQIKELDVSKLSPAEKKAIKKEVKSIENEMKVDNESILKDFGE